MQVLVIGPDTDTVETVAQGIKMRWQDDATIVKVPHGEEAVEAARSYPHTAVVVDLTTPEGRPAFDELRVLRNATDSPILTIGTRRSEADHVKALEMGADAYVHPDEGQITILAELSALMRRVKPSRRPPFVAGPLEIDYDAQVVRLEGRDVGLTNSEYRLLYTLVREEPRFVSHEELIDFIWGKDWPATVNNLKALVNRLRAKIEKPRSPRFIENQRGVGYKFMRPLPPARVAQAAG